MLGKKCGQEKSLPSLISQDSKNKFSYEVFYLRNFSLLLDLLIFLKTLKLILKMEGSDPKSHDS